MGTGQKDFYHDDNECFYFNSVINVYVVNCSLTGASLY